MRALLPLFAALALSACASAVSGPQVIEARMPLEILRAAGQPPRMGKVALEAGGTREDDPFHISFDFDSDGAALGRPKGVGLQLSFGAYCRDRPSWVEAVVIDPSGRRWPAHRVHVPAGPDRAQDWSSGYLDDADLLDAVDAGGRFTLALQDDEGRLWNTVVIDTLSPRRRKGLFAANYAKLHARNPATVPLAAEPMLVVVQQEPVALPSTPGVCPAGGA